jgi:hypothetical protein
MRRKFLLATTAAASLFVAAGMSVAQTTHEGSQGPGRQDKMQGQAGAQEHRGGEQNRAGERKSETTSPTQSNREMGAGSKKGEGAEQRSEERSGHAEQRSEEMNPRAGQRGDERAGQRTEERAGQRTEERGERKGENTRAGQRTEERGQRTEERAGQRTEERGGQRTEERGERKGENSRTGESKQERTGPRQEGMGAQTGREGRSEQMGGRAEERSNRFDSARSVNLSAEQRTRVHETIVHEHVEHVDRPTFSLDVGTPVPRTVHVYDVPEEIYVEVPQYRGLKYIIVRDEIIFIDPDTLEIVAVLPA